MCATPYHHQTTVSSLLFAPSLSLPIADQVEVVEGQRGGAAADAGLQRGLRQAAAVGGGGGGGQRLNTVLLVRGFNVFE